MGRKGSSFVSHASMIRVNNNNNNNEDNKQNEQNEEYLYILCFYFPFFFIIGKEGREGGILLHLG